MSGRDIFHLFLRLFLGELFGFADQEADDFDIIVVGFPKLECEFVVSTDLFGQFSKLREADPEAFQSASVSIVLVPIHDASLVGVFFQQREYLSLSHARQDRFVNCIESLK